MACGAALVSTDNGGVRAYAKHSETALLSPPHEPQALAANVLMLLRDPAQRLALAQRGHEAIQRFTWSEATDAIERILLQGSGTRVDMRNPELQLG
jgi:glycosyltransferase involved in cell wall biosynthesis